jgi:hypothetical protein
MALVEQVFINHHIEVHDLDGRISIRLIDESCGPGELVDETGVIEPIDGNFLVPVKSGGSTPASPEEVVYILSKLPMAVRKLDDYGENPIVIDHFFLPASDGQRLALLTAGRDAVSEVERELETGQRTEPPEWYATLTSLRDNPVRSLF